jgi:glucuronate isomerase
MLTYARNPEALMRAFLDEDFLLETRTGAALYHEVARDLPILDYHCHLPPDQIARNHRFRSLTEIWLEGDHYKWRAMRSNGVPERLITGDASDWEKFQAWAETVPATLRNPLYHWTHMELRRPFGITGTLVDGRSARAIYDRCHELLQTDDFTTQGLLRQFKVVAVCSTDDPTDSLEPHLAHARAGSPGSRLFPTWRPDKVLAVEDPHAFNAWVDKLGAAADTTIGSYADLLAALRKRHDFFHQAGCRASDLGLERLYADPYTEADLRGAFDQARAGRTVTAEQAHRFKSALLYEMALLDHARGWVQQFHVGALRNNNARLLGKLGPDTGFDSMGDFEQARPLARFLDRLDSTDQLAKTILYNNNPRDNELMATMIGNFQDGSVPGKMQFGSAWWFMDQRDGMERQIEALSNMGLLARFVGMVTDSRSFLSYPRHEYFRRLLCNVLGKDVERGLVPSDRELLAKLVRDVCFFNARNYMGLERGEE